MWSFLKFIYLFSLFFSSLPVSCYLHLVVLLLCSFMPACTVWTSVTLCNNRRKKKILIATIHTIHISTDPFPWQLSTFHPLMKTARHDCARVEIVLSNYHFQGQEWTSLFACSDDCSLFYTVTHYTLCVYVLWAKLWL